MSVQGNPYVITDNTVVFYYDPGNKKCVDVAVGYTGTTQPLAGGIYAYAYAPFNSEKFGCFQFDGTMYANWVTPGGGSVYTSISNTNYTKCIWFKRTFTGTCHLISGGRYGGESFIVNNSNSFSARNLTSATGLISNNVWYFAACTFSNTSGCKIYLNGDLIASNSNTTTNTYLSRQICIGGYGYQDDTGGNFWPGVTSYTGWINTMVGNIGPVMVYNRALSGDEILQNYNALKSRFQ